MPGEWYQCRSDPKNVRSGQLDDGIGVVQLLAFGVVELPWGLDARRVQAGQLGQVAAYVRTGLVEPLGLAERVHHPVGPGVIAGPGHPLPVARVGGHVAVREQGTEVSRELANTTDLLTQTNSRVNQFQTAVERYALSNYQALQEAEEQCVTIARECILLLDHLDIMIQRAEQKGEPVNSLRAARSRLCTLLERAQIEEIPVNAGEVFDSAVQVATSAVGSSSPEGVVVEVSRKGYAMKVRGRSDVILRAAEVTVSARQAEVQPGSGGPA